MEKTFSNIFKGDKVIWMVFFFLCIISVVEVYSASSQLTYKGGNYIAPIIKHISILLLGVFCMVITLNIKCKYFRAITPIMLIASFVLLIWVQAWGHSTNGAYRWISIFGIQFQPSEIAKGTLILATAQILSAMQTDKGADRKAFQYIMTVCVFIIPLIVIENLSTAVLLFAVIFLMMLLGRVPIIQLGKLLGLLVLAASLLLGLIMLTGDDAKTQEPLLADGSAATTIVMEQEKEDSSSPRIVLHRFDTWKARILQFFDNKEVAPEDVDLKGKDAQEAHANIAIASSNIIGKGPGKSQECDFLPQAFSDFIYAIIIEETGFAGALVVALLYVVLLFRTGRIVNRCENNFPAFLAMGLALLLVTQALFNMCVAVGLVPVTGQPLPLISKGGTSTIINCIYIGAILSVSRSAKRRDSGDGASQEQLVLQTVSEDADE